MLAIGCGYLIQCSWDEIHVYMVTTVTC